nr:hypothetical protein [Mesorhizobium sp.]
MDQTVTIKTPPTVFVTDGPELTFDLPLIPKRRFSFWLVAYFSIGVMVCFWVLGNYAKWLVPPMFGAGDFPADTFLLGLVFTGIALLILAPVIEGLLLLAITALSNRPLLEIRAEGLVDRRIFRRMVRWDEFESVGDQRHMAGRIGMRGIHSFKLRDRSVRRFSPESAFHSFVLGGRRVVIHTNGFDMPPHQILDVILAMIRNAHAEKRAA